MRRNLRRGLGKMLAGDDEHTAVSEAFERRGLSLQTPQCVPRGLDLVAPDLLADDHEVNALAGYGNRQLCDDPSRPTACGSQGLREERLEDVAGGRWREPSRADRLRRARTTGGLRSAVVETLYRDRRGGIRMSDGCEQTDLSTTGSRQIRFSARVCADRCAVTRAHADRAFDAGLSRWSAFVVSVLALTVRRGAVTPTDLGPAGEQSAILEEAIGGVDRCDEPPGVRKLERQSLAGGDACLRAFERP